MGKCKRVTERASFSEENMISAIRDVRKRKMSVKEASTHYGILKSTLYARLKRVKAEVGSLEDQEISLKMGLKIRNKCSKYASNQVFTTEEEDMFVEYLLTSSKLNYGLTMEATRKLAHEFAVRLGRRFPESWTKNLKAGKHWISGFLKRHRDISLRRPENTSLSRNTSFNRPNLTIYFDNLEQIMTDHSFVPSSIWNLDETGLSTVLQAPRVLAATSSKQVGQCVSNERGETVTIVGIINAAGHSIPPVFIFPRKRVHMEYMEGAPTGSVAFFNAKGYMNAEEFIKTLEHFKAHTEPSPSNPILLILDNHGSHLSLDAIRNCRENGIHMVSLPPHTSHRTQPLDLTVFGPFKSYCKTAFNDWLSQNPGQRITVHNVAQICASAFNKSFSSQNIKSGFAKSGIYPLDRSKVLSTINSLEDTVATTAATSLGFNGTALTSLDVCGTPPDFSGEAYSPVSIPRETSPCSLTPLDVCETPPDFSGEAYSPVSIPRVTSPCSLTPLDVCETPPDFSGDAYTPVSIPRVTSPCSLTPLDVCETLAQPLDLSTPSPGFHEMEIIRSRRAYPMSQKPLDLSKTSLVTSTSPSVSHTQLRFGLLEILRPIPNPLAFQENSRGRASRGIFSTIVTGSPEFKRKEELEMKKKVKKEALEVKKKIKMEKAKIKSENEVPKKKRGRPRKAPLSETEMKENSNSC